MNRLLVALLILVVLHARAASPVDSAPTCQLDVPVPELVSSAKVVFFGELHGTKETPALVGEYVCWLSHRSGEVIVGLEIPTTEQAAIDAYLASSGSAEDRTKLIAGAFWQYRFHDGRSSQAMVGLIERARQINHADGKVIVVAFDGREAGQARDAGMAGKLSKFIQSFPDAKVVALVGNLHALKTKGTPYDPAVEPMAFLLSPLRPISLTIDFPRGTAWTCNGYDCGVHNVGMPNRPDLAPTGFTIKHSEQSGYDGTFRLASVNASRPAVEADMQGSSESK